MDNDNDEAPPSPKVAAAKERYAAFLLANPQSRIVAFESEGDERLIVTRPWGDQSLAFAIPDDDGELVAALNSLYLPPRYTAIYHKNDRALEVIWTAWKLDEGQQELEGRKFRLDLQTSSHECEFGPSSESLTEIAKHFLPVEISRTGFRNLHSFNGLLTRTQEEVEDEDFDAYGNPLSFWIRDVDWDDDKLVNLIRHINFYLRYYDAQSPTVEIHPSEDSRAAPKNRYFEGFDFPENIHSPLLDSKLLIMYSFGFGPSWANNFLNHYRVVEYVSFDFTHDVARKEVRTIISKPHALHDVERTATDLMLVLREIKTEREQEAIPRFLKEVIQPGSLWRELEPNKAFFTARTEFEGGLVIDPIATEKTSTETFGMAGVEQFARACAKIRNGLAHGRDKASADSLLPTARNFDLLRPWVNALAFCAGEVVLYAGRH